MKRIGILGGLSAESTVQYYQIIIHEYERKFGDINYPEILVFSASLGEFLDWEEAGRWDLVANKAVESLRRLADAGAEIGLIATNTVHRVFEEVASRSPIPLIDIVEETAKVIQSRGISHVGILGTRFTMEADFYSKGLRKFDVEVSVPRTEDRIKVHRIITERLVRGIINSRDRLTMLQVIDSLLAEEDVEGIVLACTELPLLVRPEDVPMPVFDTTRIHALAALEAAISEGA